MTNKRFRTILDVIPLEEQADFRKSKYCIADASALKDLLHKKRKLNLEAHLAFVESEKAFDKVNRCKVFEIVVNREYPTHVGNVIESHYRITEIVIGTLQHLRFQYIKGYDKCVIHHPYYLMYILMTSFENG